jgi:hypothetical protein
VAAKRARPDTLTATARAKDRRGRVLAHPGIAHRLTLPPLNYKQPDQWTGYIPPGIWREQTNSAPERAALLDICAAVMEREAEAVDGEQPP